MNTDTMTLETANQIWNDCYNSTDFNLWDKWTWQDREEALRVRTSVALGGDSGQWGIWNISDRH